jgi:N-acetylglucosamine-6-phosphate deacetylase
MSVIAGARLVTPDGVIDDGWLELAGAKIATVGSGQPPAAVDQDVAGNWIVPGFVDIHAHGGGGATVVGADPDQVKQFAGVHLAHGTTTIMASLVTGYYDDLQRDVRSLAELTADGVVAGVHLEGPWISPKRRGAHNPDALRAPEPRAVRKLLDAGAGAVRMVTLAPELEDGIDAVRTVVAAGAIAAIGHTDATYEVTASAIDAGATVATHLFNAMTPVHHREPGPIPALLEDDRISVELVCDGVHLHPAIVSMAQRLAGARRAVLVTDSMAAAGYADGTYPLGELEVVVKDGVARLEGDGTIAGSTLTMSSAFAFAVQQAGFSMSAAVEATATNPARLLGLGDRVGALRAGLDADLVMLDSDLKLQSVMAKGAWVPITH